MKFFTRNQNSIFYRKKIKIHEILNLARKFQHILCENERYVCKTQTKKSRQIEGMNTHDYLKSNL